MPDKTIRLEQSEESDHPAESWLRVRRIAGGVANLYINPEVINGVTPENQKTELPAVNIAEPIETDGEQSQEIDVEAVRDDIDEVFKEAPK